MLNSSLHIRINLILAESVEIQCMAAGCGSQIRRWGPGDTDDLFAMWDVEQGFRSSLYKLLQSDFWSFFTLLGGFRSKGVRDVLLECSLANSEELRVLREKTSLPSQLSASLESLD